MQGARPEAQSDRASNVQQQEQKLPSLLSVDDDGKLSEPVEYPPLMQVNSWTKSVPFSVCKKKCILI
jgi:hypothetical protein